MFDSTKEDLKDLLAKVGDGRLQLPDFQRDYVWKDSDVRSLIASIAKGFPVGALLTLETGGDVNFKPRLLAGVDPGVRRPPSELLLDGQQRITSLYQVLCAQRPVRTKNDQRQEVERFYYLSIPKACAASANIEDAIVGVPADRVLRRFGRDVELDVSTPELEYEHDLFPLNRLFDSRQWEFAWEEFWRGRGEDRRALNREFVNRVLDRIQRYKMPIIRLDRENSREAICLVFEKVNVGGQKLDAFDLVTAIYAASGFDLRDDWLGSASSAGRRGRIRGNDGRRNVLRQVESTDFLQACTLLHSRAVRLEQERRGVRPDDLPAVSCKKEAMLSLPLAGYRSTADLVERGYCDAAGFVNSLKIMHPKDVPYLPQLTMLAAVFAAIPEQLHSAAERRKLGRWFWCVALGEQYGSATDSKLARDLPELVAWIRDAGPIPRAVEESNFQEQRLRSLRSRLSAAYKAIHALLMRRQCRDFISGEAFELMTFHEKKVDVHHVFPKAWCKSKGIAASVYDAIINKTPLSKKSNQIIGGHAPSVYLEKIEAKYNLSHSELDAILESHLIEPRFLREDDFEGFYAARTGALSQLVGAALEKPVVSGELLSEPLREDEGSEEPELWDSEE
jgi:hypothetical protein